MYQVTLELQKSPPILQTVNVDDEDLREFLSTKAKILKVGYCNKYAEQLEKSKQLTAKITEDLKKLLVNVELFANEQWFLDFLDYLNKISVKY